MSILGFIGEVFEPAAKVIDEIHTSDEERAEAKRQLYEAQARLQSKVLEYETTLMEERAKVVTAEAEGESWLQRNWRPATMVWFSSLLGLVFFGQAPEYMVENPELIERLFDLLTLGITGYIGGRTVEKLAGAGAGKKVMEAIKKVRGKD